jgi:hypothetical protein
VILGMQFLICGGSGGGNLTQHGSHTERTRTPQSFVVSQFISILFTEYRITTSGAKNAIFTPSKYLIDAHLGSSTTRPAINAPINYRSVIEIIKQTNRGYKEHSLTVNRSVSHARRRYYCLFSITNNRFIDICTIPQHPNHIHRVHMYHICAGR